MLILSKNLSFSADPFSIPQNCGQIILGITRDWNSSDVLLQKFGRTRFGWREDGKSWLGRIGRKGLAWGRGLHPAQKTIDAPIKTEGDGRAPAGVFALGGAYGYALDPPRLSIIPYQQVTERDLWIEDAASEYYNMHLRIEGSAPLTPWQLKQQMKLNEHPHSLKIFIKHNAPPDILPNAGSSIFFHIWRRDGNASTAGCTTMSEENLRKLIQWLDPTLNPLYVILPNSVYKKVRVLWRLP